MRLTVPALSILLAAALAFPACGGGGFHASQPEVQRAIDGLEVVRKAAKDGDVEGAKAAFENARGPIQVVANLVKPVDAEMAADLEGMILHLDSHFETGGNAPHIVVTVEDFQRMLEEAGNALKGPKQ